jgi:hypothetical protein
MGAFTFRKGVYAEAEADNSFTSNAWLIVAVTAFLAQLGAQAGIASQSLVSWLIAATVAAVFAVLGFALAAWVISWLGKSFFKADVTFEEVVRTLGLAYVWNLVSFIGIVAIISSTLSCVLAPITLVGALAGLVAWAIAVKEALDLEWVQTIIVVLIGFVITWILSAIAGFVLGIIGISAAGIMGAFGS